MCLCGSKKNLAQLRANLRVTLCYNLATDAQIFNAKPTKFFAKFEKENFKDYKKISQPEPERANRRSNPCSKKSVSISV